MITIADTHHINERQGELCKEDRETKIIFSIKITYFHRIWTWSCLIYSQI